MGVAVKGILIGQYNYKNNFIFQDNINTALDDTEAVNLTLD